jgi:hypothetical protein
MNRMTRQVLPVAAAVAIAALVAGTGIASANAEPDAAAAGAAELVTSAAAGGRGAAAPAPAPAPVAAGGGALAAAGGGASAAAVAGAAAPAEPLPVACENSDLPPHTGFEIGPACVATAFGEVAAAEDNPQLLITEAPDEVTVGQAFTIKVSTRNLVRDRFLPAAEGGYYVEPSTLNGNGLVRGHFHTACRVLGDIGRAPEPERQAVFVATEDGGGGTAPDTVTVKIPGLAAAGQAQCATWAGDGSHRMPMMQFANQIPAFDAVRLTVTSEAEKRTPADAGQRPGAGQRADAGQRPGAGQRADAGQRPGAGQRADAGQRPDSGR